MIVEEELADPSSSSAKVPMLRRGPGLLFHLCLVAPTLIWFWSESTPGLLFLPWLASTVTLGIGALTWSVRLAAFTYGRCRNQTTKRGRWYLAAPVLGMASLGFVTADVPLKIRWTQCRTEFNQVAKALLDGERTDSVRDERLGACSVHFVDRRDDALVFYDTDGAFINDAGYAYLPDGPSPDLANGNFENPQFRHLGGPWYAWTASW